ncbi:hypothetical protein ACFSPU_10805 [Haoranjiania flava]|uniref:Uncharacterized protein n=1 Tax=Haoranjiania flava TaxID=1856322 RepID=A0AAE3ILE3_9BACT|nr:hypothetical protein [Haoranjiania flava]MCU7694300.1 hypothetical protein [Haoranjiania flava]
MTDILLIVILVAVMILAVLIWLNDRKARSAYSAAITNCKKENQRLISENHSMRNQLQSALQLETKLKTLMEENNKLRKTISRKQQPQQPKAEEKTVFYMLKPIDNYFPAELKTDDASGTVYEITLEKNNANTGTFVIHTKGAQPQEIIRRSEVYLKPGCIEQNVAAKDAKKIITEQPGKVMLENDKWVIKEKAVIRYE